jgi:hypothetical protein
MRALFDRDKLSAAAAMWWRKDGKFSIKAIAEVFEISANALSRLLVAQLENKMLAAQIAFDKRRELEILEYYTPDDYYFRKFPERRKGQTYFIETQPSK